MHGLNKKIKAFNDIRKRAFKGDVDKNSVFVDLMKTLSPRTLGLKLQFYKGAQGVVAAGIDLHKFQKQLNETLLQENYSRSKQTLLSPRSGRHINIFYLKDKIIENQTMHEKFEALAILRT